MFCAFIFFHVRLKLILSKIDNYFGSSLAFATMICPVGQLDIITANNSTGSWHESIPSIFEHWAEIMVRTGVR